VTAFLGIIGTLVGIILGAFLTRWIDFTYQRRKEVQATVEAALILREELTDMKAGMEVLLGKGHFSLVFDFTGLSAWEAYRGKLLNGGLPHPQWRRLYAIFRHLVEVKGVMERNPTAQITEPIQQTLEGAIRQCSEGIAFLDPFATEAQVPLLSPQRIFRPAL
jgi:hypothetical protein